MNPLVVVALSGGIVFGCAVFIAYKVGEIMGRAHATHEAIHGRVIDIRDGRL
jgi:hypothetical protein